VYPCYGKANAKLMQIRMKNELYHERRTSCSLLTETYEDSS
jgi:hypothetical protein